MVLPQIPKPKIEIIIFASIIFFLLTNGWSLRQALRSSANRCEAIPDIFYYLLKLHNFHQIKLF